MKTRNHASRTVNCCTAALLALTAGHIASAQCTSSKLTASDAASWDAFANSIAMSTTAGGPVAILGAPTDDNIEGESAGAVYVFSRVNGVWGETAKFFPLDLNDEFSFGHAVAYTDPYLIVGAPGVDAPDGMDCGAFYMYERFGSTWVSKGRYIPSWASDTSRVGWSVDVTTANGGRAIIGAPDSDWDGSAAAGMQNPDSGAAYIYERLGDGNWGYVTAVWDYDAAGTGASQHLGQAVAIEGNIAVIGAPNGEAPGKPNLSGYVKILRRSVNGTWNISGPARLSPADAQEVDLFGYSVDTDGQYVVVGALNHDSTAAQTPAQGATFTTGCVYVYKWNLATEQFDLDGQLFADDAISGLQMGGNVRISGGKVFASSYAYHKVYCFKRLGANNWVQEYVVNDAEPGPSTSFAGDFAVAGDAMIVGDASDTRGALLSTGAAFAFTIGTNTDAGNDSCAGARAVAAGNHYGCTDGATYSLGSTCGAGGGNGPGPDVWYAWTPGCSGNVIIDTIGSNYDTVLSVHSDCPEIGNAHQIACNDDASGFGLQSLVTFNFTRDTTYYIRVGGYNGHAGDYVLRINDYAPAPSNNACASPTNVTSGGTYTWANCKATTDGPSSATVCGFHMVNDVWFRFVPPVNGTLKLDTCGSNFDTMIGLFASGVGCPNDVQELACNDDAPANSPCPQQVRTSYLTRSVLAGVPYMIRVGGYDSTDPTGDAIMHVDFDASCPCDWNLSGAISVQDIFDFLASYFSGQGDFNQSGATTVQDIFDFLTCYFGGCN